MVYPAKAADQAPQGERLTTLRALRKTIPNSGVDRGADPNGAIRGFSVITRGQANWGWIDDTFLEGVRKFGAEASPRLKSRFAHPGLSSDGLGKLLGRVVNFRRTGDQVFGDLEFTESASETPDGDLAGYTMKLAEETPDLFGTSIVFYHDIGAEDLFQAEHTDDEGTFISPDAENKKNLPHWRIASLEAVDVVDEPAANPAGLFSRGSELARDAEATLDYALGLNTELPARAFLGKVHPERVRRFLTGYLARKGLSLRRDGQGDAPALRKEQDMSEKQTQDEAAAPGGAAEKQSKGEAPSLPAEKPAEVTAVAAVEEKLATACADGAKAESARFAALKAAFPERLDFVVAQFEAGASIEEARAAFRDVEIQELKNENARLKSAVEGTGPVDFSGEQDEKSHLDQAHEYAIEHGCSVTEALKKTAPKRR